MAATRPGDTGGPRRRAMPRGSGPGRAPTVSPAEGGGGTANRRPPPPQYTDRRAVPGAPRQDTRSPPRLASPPRPDPPELAGPSRAGLGCRAPLLWAVPGGGSATERSRSGAGLPDKGERSGTRWGGVGRGLPAGAGPVGGGVAREAAGGSAAPGAGGEEVAKRFWGSFAPLCMLRDPPQPVRRGVGRDREGGTHAYPGLKPPPLPHRRAPGVGAAGKAGSEQQAAGARRGHQKPEAFLSCSPPPHPKSRRVYLGKGMLRCQARWPLLRASVGSRGAAQDRPAGEGAAGMLPAWPGSVVVAPASVPGVLGTCCLH